MRISGAKPSSAIGIPREAGRAGGVEAGFSLASSGGGGAAAVRGGGAALPMTSLGALMALQTVPDALRRRRRKLRRGRDLLAGLDEIHLALLEGSLSPSTLVRLRTELAAMQEDSDDPALDDLLREIEVRAAVELAKLEREAEAA